MPFFKKSRAGGKTTSGAKKGGGKATTHSYGAQHQILGNPGLGKGNGATRKR